jgi:CheY-like chemotaxis protein
MKNRNFYTTGEIAKITGISQKTIINYCTKGKIKSEQTPVTNYRRILKENLVRFMNENSISLDLMEKESAKRILIIDDDQAVADTVEWVLEGISDTFIIETAENGYEGCIKAGSFKPDLIILDLLMPVADGFEVCRNIRNSREISNTEIIILTGYATEENIKRLKGYGIKHVLDKPFDNIVFREIIERALSLTKLELTVK